MPGTVAEGQSGSLSFACNFWGKDDAGVIPMLERMHNSKVTCDELRSFYNIRAAIEDEYARKLLSLCRRSFGTSETGSLRESLDVVRGETEAAAKAHAAISSQMKRELEEPLVAFAGGLKERRKIVQGGIERILKTKIQQTQAVNKARDRYEQDCLRIKGYLAQGHMVMGQEERKNKSKLEKTQNQLAANSNEYEAVVKVLEDTTGRWNKEWKAACDKFQDLEEERLDFTKSSLWTYANIASTVCVSDDASCEKIRLSLEDCEVEKDIAYFIKDKGTGSEIPDPPKFVDFWRGDGDDSSSEASEDEVFSPVQFQRAINPGLRSSSPQPSTYESHHDPNSDLALRMGHGLPPTVPEEKESIVPSHQDTMQQQPPKPEPPRGRQAPLALEPSTHKDARSAPRPAAPDREAAPASHKPTANRPAQRPPSRNPAQPADVGMDPQPAHTPEEIPAAPPKAPTARQPPPLDLRRGGQLPPNYDPDRHGEIAAIPHNAYPTDGMTMLCRTGPPSERSSNASGYRPSSRASQSESSNATSFSSQEPPPAKPSDGAPQPGADGEKQVQKRRSAFFGNSPFRRKSRHEKERQPAPSSQAGSRNTWSAPSKQNSPIRPAQARRPTINTDAPNETTEPADPRANFQLNVGNNVFDVASPDAETSKKAPQQPGRNAGDDSDPIARALAGLKSAGKQPSSRISADRYHGIATPAPSTAAAPQVGPAATATPPPAYNDPSVKRLDAPRPAFTASQMQRTTQKYIGQTQNVFRGNSDDPNARLAGRSSGEAPRARSPVPRRSISPQVAPRSETRTSQYNQYGGRVSPQVAPRPETRTSQYSGRVSPQVAPRPETRTSQYSGRVSPHVAPRPEARASPYSRGVSPNPGAYQSSSMRSRYSQQAATTPPQRPSDVPYSPRDYSRRNSRAVSPQPQFRQQSRPSSSSGGMELQLSNPMDAYGGGGSDGYGMRGGQPHGRPMSSYYGGSDQSSRGRSKTLTVAEPGRHLSRDGRQILHFARAMYSYTAAIPEELGFAKGDTLSIIRLQDDGWWEAEIAGIRSPTGLVPSNYLQII